MDRQTPWRRDIAYVALQTSYEDIMSPHARGEGATCDLPGEQPEELTHLSDSQGRGGNSHCNPKHIQDCVMNVISHTSKMRRAGRTRPRRVRCCAAARKRFVRSSFRPNP